MHVEGWARGIGRKAAIDHSNSRQNTTMSLGREMIVVAASCWMLEGCRVMDGKWNSSAILNWFLLRLIRPGTRGRGPTENSFADIHWTSSDFVAFLIHL